MSGVDSNGQTIWIADAHRGDGKRLVVHADEKLTPFLELASAIRSGKANVTRHSARLIDWRTCQNSGPGFCEHSSAV